jgi:hypothetical protein
MMRYQCLQNFISIASAQIHEKSWLGFFHHEERVSNKFSRGTKQQRIKRSGWERRASASASASGIGSGDDEAIIMPRRGKPLEHPD